MLNSDRGRLSALSDAALRAELVRAIAERVKRTPPPPPLAEPNWQVLVTTITSGVERAVAEGYIDKFLKGYIFEAALEAVYGNAIWSWWNAQDQPG